MTDRELIEAIKAALNTEEDGEALIEVARGAHDAEMEIATMMRCNGGSRAGLAGKRLSTQSCRRRETRHGRTGCDKFVIEQR